MSYTSPDLGASPLVVTTANAATLTGPRGHEPRDWSERPLGYCAKVADLTPIKFNEIIPLVKEREAAGRTNRALKKLMGFQPFNQGQTNFCWANATVYALMYAQAMSGQKPLPLSSASVACRITDFRNDGGWGVRACEFMRENGVNLASEWPSNAIDRRYDTPENREKAKQRRVTEWLDFPSQELTPNERALLLATAVLNGIPVSTGHNWMRHQVTIVDVVIVNGKAAWYCDNSGYGRDANGVTILEWSQGIYDDAVAPVVSLPIVE